MFCINLRTHLIYSILNKTRFVLDVNVLRLHLEQTWFMSNIHLGLCFAQIKMALPPWEVKLIKILKLNLSNHIIVKKKQENEDLITLLKIQSFTSSSNRPVNLLVKDYGLSIYKRL